MYIKQALQWKLTISFFLFDPFFSSFVLSIISHNFLVALEFPTLIHITRSWMLRIWHFFEIEWGLLFRQPQYLFLLLLLVLLLATENNETCFCLDWLESFSSSFFFFLDSFLFTDACPKSICQTLSEFHCKFSSEICSGNFLCSLRFLEVHKIFQVLKVGK